MKRCEICNLPFWNEEQLRQHIGWHNCSKTFTCTHCGRGFVKNERRKLHEKTCDNNSHRQHCAPQRIQHGEGITTGKFKLFESALNGVVRGYRYEFPTDNHQIDSLKKLSEILHGDAKRIIKESYDEQKLFKWHIGLKAVFHKAMDVSLITDQPPYFQTLPLESYLSQDLDSRIEEAYIILRDRIDNYEEMGSGWVLNHFKCVDLRIIEMANPLIRNNEYDSSSDEEEET